MCGLFGCLTPHGASTTSKVLATTATTILGVCSVERGKDSAGIAAVDTRAPKKGEARTSTPRHADLNSPTTAIDNTVIVKNTGTFTDLDLSDYMGVLDGANLLIGHTRAATQGDKSKLTNCSPLISDTLVGTHNGDVDTATLPAYTRELTWGGTDTERLYAALSRGRADRRKITKTLREMHGRAALVWVDRARPDRLYIARAALSPLVIGFDEHGTMYWASNPAWFDTVNESLPHRVTIGNITIVPEGTLLTIDTANAKIIDTRRFTPTCRERDIALTNSAIYRGYSKEDKAADQQTHSHKVAARPNADKRPGFTPRGGTSTWEFGSGATRTTHTTTSSSHDGWGPNAHYDREAELRDEYPSLFSDHDDPTDYVHDVAAAAGVDIEKFEDYCNANPDVGDQLYEAMFEALLGDDTDTARRLFLEVEDSERRGTNPRLRAVS